MYKESNDKKAAAVPGNDANTKHDAAFSDNTFWVSRKKAAERIIMGIDPGTIRGAQRERQAGQDGCHGCYRPAESKRCVS